MIRCGFVWLLLPSNELSQILSVACLIRQLNTQQNGIGFSAWTRFMHCVLLFGRYWFGKPMCGNWHVCYLRGMRYSSVWFSFIYYQNSYYLALNAKVLLKCDCCVREKYQSEAFEWTIKNHRIRCNCNQHSVNQLNVFTGIIGCFWRPVKIAHVRFAFGLCIKDWIDFDFGFNFFFKGKILLQNVKLTKQVCQHWSTYWFVSAINKIVLLKALIEISSM